MTELDVEELKRVLKMVEGGLGTSDLSPVPIRLNSDQLAAIIATLEVGAQAERELDGLADCLAKLGIKQTQGTTDAAIRALEDRERLREIAEALLVNATRDDPRMGYWKCDEQDVCALQAALEKKP